MAQNTPADAEALLSLAIQLRQLKPGFTGIRHAGCLVAESIRLGAFANVQHVLLRADVEDCLHTNDPRKMRVVFVVAMHHLESMGLLGPDAPSTPRPFMWGSSWGPEGMGQKEESEWFVKATTALGDFIERQAAQLAGGPVPAIDPQTPQLWELRKPPEGNHTGRDSTGEAVAGAAAGVPQQDGTLEHAPTAMVSHLDLAKRFDLNPEALRKRLDRWRAKNSDGWSEVTDRKPHDPQYLYRVSAVSPIIEEMVRKASGQTSG